MTGCVSGYECSDWAKCARTGICQKTSGEAFDLDSLRSRLAQVTKERDEAKAALLESIRETAAVAAQRERALTADNAALVKLLGEAVERCAKIAELRRDVFGGEPTTANGRQIVDHIVAAIRKDGLASVPQPIKDRIEKENGK